jgi:hypothetical protein
MPCPCTLLLAVVAALVLLLPANASAKAACDIHSRERAGFAVEDWVHVSGVSCEVVTGDQHEIGEGPSGRGAFDSIVEYLARWNVPRGQSRATIERFVDKARPLVLEHWLCHAGEVTLSYGTLHYTVLRAVCYRGRATVRAQFSS